MRSRNPRTRTGVLDRGDVPAYRGAASRTHSRSQAWVPRPPAPLPSDPVAKPAVEDELVPNWPSSNLLLPEIVGDELVRHFLVGFVELGIFCAR